MFTFITRPGRTALLLDSEMFGILLLLMHSPLLLVTTSSLAFTRLRGPA